MSDLFNFFCLVPLFFSTLAAEISDPFQWLENSQDPRTEEWLEVQKEKFDQYTTQNPYQNSFRKSLHHLLNYESYSLPLACDRLLFFKMSRPQDEQPILYVQEGLEGTPRILLDPNLLSHSSLSTFVPSPDGKWVACALSESGSDWLTWKILEVASGKQIADQIEKSKFLPITWTPDSQGFVYTRVDSDDVYRIYHHPLHTHQTNDILIFDNCNDPDFFADIHLTDDGKTVIVNRDRGSVGPHHVLIRSLESPFQSLFPLGKSKYKYLGDREGLLYFWTNHEAPFGKVIAVDCETLAQKEIIPESNYFLDQVSILKDALAVVYIKNVTSHLEIFNPQGEKLREVPLPALGSVALSPANLSPSGRDNSFFFSFTHFVQPAILYHYEIETDELKIFKEPQLTFNPSDYEVKQIFYPSKDGTEVPLFLVHKKGIECDGNHKTLLSAYGGFGIGLYPSYNSLYMSWIESGGIFALANIRGGSELGEQWHEAGIREKRQNCFDDFISAAEWLIGNRYTNPSKLAIRGGSNGGLLMAVCLNQRADLFGAALVEVGVLDMLRYHLFTVGRFWMGEYGDPDNPEDRKFLSHYSPYHNIQKGPYPPILVTTADHDDRVVPSHSYKYTAAMQAAGHSNTLLRVSKKSGHGAGKSISQWIEDAAGNLSFIRQSLSN